MTQLETFFINYGAWFVVCMGVFIFYLSIYVMPHTINRMLARGK